MAVDELLATPTLTSKDMPYVTFTTETIEDPVRTKAEGRMCYKDQDYAVSTVPGDKGNNIYKIETFFERKQEEARNGRVHPEWLTKWKHDYELYRAGQEIPEDGTPIKGWKLISGAQQAELLRINVRTVEALANLNDDGIRNFGMGALEMKRRAKAWIEQNQSKEKDTLLLADLMRQVESLTGTVRSLTEKNEELERAVSKKK